MSTPAWSTVWVCVLAVGLMGFAIQRGGTCTVAAVDEILSQRRVTRFSALLEASLWVMGGLALAQLAHWPGSMPAGHALSRWTVVGGVLLGMGAWVNGACVFGAIARLGSGQWAQALTPVGFFAGCWGVAAGLQPAMQSPPQGAAFWPAWVSASWLAPLFVLYALWRVGLGLLAGARQPKRARQLAAKVWAPHAATVVIGLTYVVCLLLAGAWAYTDVLARWAQRMRADPVQEFALPLGLLAALYGGALWGGWTAGRWRPALPTATDLLRALGGGALMGLGSLLIPGSNDGLILIGLPLMRPYAGLAFASMVVTIAGALGLQRAWRARSAAAG